MAPTVPPSQTPSLLERHSSLNVEVHMPVGPGVNDFFIASNYDTVSSLNNQVIICFYETLTVTPTWVMFASTITNSYTLGDSTLEAF